MGWQELQWQHHPGTPRSRRLQCQKTNRCLCQKRKGHTRHLGLCGRHTELELGVGRGHLRRGQSSAWRKCHFERRGPPCLPDSLPPGVSFCGASQAGCGGTPGAAGAGCVGPHHGAVLQGGLADRQRGYHGGTPSRGWGTATMALRQMWEQVPRAEQCGERRYRPSKGTAEESKRDAWHEGKKKTKMEHGSSPSIDRGGRRDGGVIGTDEEGRAGGGQRLDVQSNTRSNRETRMAVKQLFIFIHLTPAITKQYSKGLPC